MISELKQQIQSAYKHIHKAIGYATGAGNCEFTHQKEHFQLMENEMRDALLELHKLLKDLKE